MKHILAGAALALGTLSAQASIVTVTPDDAPVAVSQPFGAVAEYVTNQYGGFGLYFAPNQVAVFNDPPLAWGGVNAAGIVDLLSPVSASFTSGMVSNHLSVEIGYAAVGTLTLSAYDIHGNLLGSTVNDDGHGPHERTLATLDFTGMHSFTVTGSTDSWGMNQVQFASLTPVPEPESLALMLAGLGALALRGRRRPVREPAPT